MTSIAFKYIFKKLSVSLLIIAPIITILVWLTASLKYVNLIVVEDISVIAFLELIACRLPDISGNVLPICALISMISIFYKMQNDKEVMVLMTSGKSKFSIALPLFTFAISVSSVILILQTQLSPHSNRNFINIQQKIQNQVSMSIVKPRIFNAVGNSVIYIGDKTKDSLADIFISYIPKDKRTHTNIITAKKGSYVVEENRLFINLEQGYRQELDENNKAISTLKFDSFSYDVTDFVRRYSKKPGKPYEKTQSELIKGANETEDKKQKLKYLSEYHSRIIIPFIPFINSIIISIFMMHAYIKNRKVVQSCKGFVAGISCQIFIMSLANASATYGFLIYLNYIILLLIVLFLLFLSFKRKLT